MINEKIEKEKLLKEAAQLCQNPHSWVKTKEYEDMYGPFASDYECTKCGKKGESGNGYGNLHIKDCIMREPK